MSAPAARLLDLPLQEKLSEYLAAHLKLIGLSVTERFQDEGAAEGNLPFLLKVLIIEKALSIQTPLPWTRRRRASFRRRVRTYTRKACRWMHPPAMRLGQA
ncbi:hypothetical protein BD311DRAFT_268199 [Dichomitus squalens]|uniref:Uncharacterized protein n=1 Tax=Dichomitus squalens TaxID=114155 RepID=A0A4Q9MS19_9APHY|nr:hypothetical protein BD311DRAFT_268199 [Dichomitus squalens]